MRKRQIPNLLTFARILAVPVTFIAMFTLPPLHPVFFWIFLAAFLTDFLDGFLARRWNAVTPLGTLLDPTADKLLVGLMLIYLLAISGSGESVRLLTNPLFIPVSIILLRELYISGLREFLASRQIELPVSKSGKLKTSLQMVGILLMLSPPVTHSFTPLSIGWGVLWLSAVVAFVSAVLYTLASRKAMRG